MTTDKAGWELLGKVAADIVKTWDKIPLSAPAKLSPEERQRRKDAYNARKAEKAASAAAA